jgi:hypothetical protein
MSASSNPSRRRPRRQVNLPLLHLAILPRAIADNPNSRTPLSSDEIADFLGVIGDAIVEQISPSTDLPAERCRPVRFIELFR